MSTVDKPCDPHEPSQPPAGDDACSPDHGGATVVNNGLVNIGDVTLFDGLHLLSDNVVLNDLDAGGIANDVLGNVLSDNTVGDVLSHNAIANVVSSILSGDGILDNLFGGNPTAVAGVAESGEGDANGVIANTGILSGDGDFLNGLLSGNNLLSAELLNHISGADDLLGGILNESAASAPVFANMEHVLDQLVSSHLLFDVDTVHLNDLVQDVIT